MGMVQDVEFLKYYEWCDVRPTLLCRSGIQVIVGEICD